MLKHIKTQTCPKCSAVPIREKVNETTHINGNRGEERSFACGYSVEHVPNYADRNGNHERFLGECTRSSAYREKQEKRKNMAQNIKELINDMEPKDPAFVERITRELNFLTGQGYVS